MSAIMPRRVSFALAFSFIAIGVAIGLRYFLYAGTSEQISDARELSERFPARSGTSDAGVGTAVTPAAERLAQPPAAGSVPPVPEPTTAVEDLQDEAPPSPGDSTEVARRKLIKRLLKELQAAPAEPDRASKLRLALSLSIATLMDKAGTSIQVPVGQKFRPQVDLHHAGFVSGDNYYRFRQDEFPEYAMVQQYMEQLGSASRDAPPAARIQFDEVYGLVQERAYQAILLIADAR